MILVRVCVLLLILLSSKCAWSSMSSVYLAPNSGYKGIVVKIDKDVDQDHCQEIINNVKVSRKNKMKNRLSQNIYLSLQALFTKASSVLHTALSGRAYFSRVTIVVPSFWSAKSVTKTVRL